MNICSVIVTYNPDLNKLSNLVEKLSLDGIHIILVDNASDFKFGFKKSKNLNFISLDENFGIAKAQNIGIVKAVESFFDHIIFLDQDSVINSDFFQKLYSDYTSILNQKIAAIGPRFIDEKKGFYFPALRFNKYGLIDKISVENISSPVEVSFLISSGTLVSVEALNDIGLMKEEFFIDFVDTEWCFRALSKGYKIYMSERAVMKHSIGDDTLKIYKFNIPVHSGFRRYYRIRNLFFMWKMPYIPKVLIIKLMITNFIIQILLFLIKDKKKEYLKFYIKAIKDGLKQSKDYQV